MDEGDSSAVVVGVAAGSGAGLLRTPRLMEHWGGRSDPSSVDPLEVGNHAQPAVTLGCASRWRRASTFLRSASEACPSSESPAPPFRHRLVGPVTRADDRMEDPQRLHSGQLSRNTSHRFRPGVRVRIEVNSSHRVGTTTRPTSAAPMANWVGFAERLLRVQRARGPGRRHRWAWQSSSRSRACQPDDQNRAHPMSPRGSILAAARSQGERSPRS